MAYTSVSVTVAAPALEAELQGGPHTLDVVSSLPWRRWRRCGRCCLFASGVVSTGCFGGRIRAEMSRL